MDNNILNIQKEEDWSSVLPTYGPAAGITLLVAVVSFSCIGYHFYKKRQIRLARIAEAQQQGEQNREIHAEMRREREASDPRNVPMEMANF